MRALRIPVDADEPIREVQVDKLEDYQAIVGGWVEAVDIHSLGITIYVAEEGLIMQLPFNSRASFLWWYFVPEARQKAMLVGPALITGLPDRVGQGTDIPSQVADQLLSKGEWRVEVKVHGDPKWYKNSATYDDYFEALVWAMVTLERWTLAEDTRVVPVPPDELAGEEAPPPAARRHQAPTHGGDCPD
ncbi:DUF3846 domain-containing protein [Agromyces bauzanensis]|uniref:DUF3846 domain-containing protein n=1 Tax=Agromyces bauzanensis TaxID=1308924 RepID=UPI001664F922|nr:DUF3846 domain-containing protein [Agromyces bauzanensis]